MSEPIMELVGEYARAVEGGTGAQVEAAQAAIEREVAALREQKETWVKFAVELGAKCDANDKRITDLEAENAANAGRVDSLKAAIELLNGNLELFKGDVKRLEAERDTLEAERAALMADAERYRWFRTHENWRDGGPFDSYYGADLDAAVDEARIQIP